MNLFTTNVLTGAINSLVATPSHLLDTYFPFVQSEQTEEIHFDLIDKTRRLAPFVSPVLAGKVVDAQGFNTKTFKPAYLKPKTPFDANRPLKRIPGEKLGGILSPEQRLQFLVAQQLLDHKDMIRRRMEVMASEAMRTGKVTVTGDGYPTVVVDFGRDAALTKVLAAGSKWSDSGVSPLDTLQNWAQLVLQKSGAMPIDVTMDVASWIVFRNDADVKSRLDLRNAAGSVLNQGAQIKEGAVLMGVVDNFNIWVYSGWYLDDSGNEQPILPTGTVVMSNGTQLEGTQAFGAIRDEAAGFQAFEFFSKSWVEQDPSVRYVLTQSAPLVVPSRVNASFCATVL
jgi:hypothetical protein